MKMTYLRGNKVRFIYILVIWVGCSWGSFVEKNATLLFSVFTMALFWYESEVFNLKEELAGVHESLKSHLSK